ncbi:HNH endonuclease signature motif containing protein, partial [Luteimicrobium sp. DT211]|uniref:HNH endonuclease signature motif containing protein n=1 Tax=Luteimicrobium sp. DT211 TaxID=3393412 RepID=UPI003CEDEB42
VPVLALLRTLTRNSDGPADDDPDDSDSAAGGAMPPPPPRAARPTIAARGAPSGPDARCPDEPSPDETFPDAALLGAPADALSSDVAYLDGYGPIDDHTATLLTAAAPSLRRLLTDPHTGVVLALGRETYTVPADLRAFLRLRDGTCRFPGCSRAADRCDVDHTTAYVTGGTTDATNLAHLCRTHHRLKHATRWNARQAGTDGTLVWTSPTGAEHVTRPATTLTGLTSSDAGTGAADRAGRTVDDDPPPF